MFEIDDSNLEGFAGVTAGVQVEERWQYPGVGYNGPEGKFYIGEEDAATLEIVPFALRQCKEVTDAMGVIHRYHIKAKRTDMVEGDVKTRVQVVGLVNGELHVFGARSWTARAAWVNPLNGAYHDPNFEGGIWPRLAAHIKETRIRRGIATAPLCYRLHLAVGDPIVVTSAKEAKNKTTTHPIVATKLTFVGDDQAQANARLYVEEALDEWVAEWNRNAVAVDDTAADAPPPLSYAPFEDDWQSPPPPPSAVDPLALAIMALPQSELAFRDAASASRFIDYLTGFAPRDDNRLLEVADKIINARADGMSGKADTDAAVALYKQVAPAVEDDLFGDADYIARQDAAKATLAGKGRAKAH